MAGIARRAASSFSGSGNLLLNHVREALFPDVLQRLQRMLRVCLVVLWSWKQSPTSCVAHGCAGYRMPPTYSVLRIGRPRAANIMWPESVPFTCRRTRRFRCRRTISTLNRVGRLHAMAADGRWRVMVWSCCSMSLKAHSYHCALRRFTVCTVQNTFQIVGHTQPEAPVLTKPQRRAAVVGEGPGKAASSVRYPAIVESGLSAVHQCPCSTRSLPHRSLTVTPANLAKSFSVVGVFASISIAHPSPSQVEREG